MDAARRLLHPVEVARVAGHPVELVEQPRHPGRAGAEAQVVERPRVGHVVGHQGALVADRADHPDEVGRPPGRREEHAVAGHAVEPEP